MLTRSLGVGLALAVTLCASCGDDAGGAPDGGGECTMDSECSDGIFCSGEERCVAGSCETGAPPCPAPLLCDEAGGVCQSPGCDTATDADGDGVEAIACGGDDCDDADADRFPGNPEVCDGADQDCDPSTFGTTDEDDDGAISAMCCDGSVCGTDCDDSDPAVGPTGTEACNAVDDDCDGRIDEGVLRAFYPDSDGDNFGDRDGSLTLACNRGDGLTENALDCDDTDAAVNPTGLERCNGVDDNCNGTVDDPDATALSCTATFGSPPNTFFSCSDASCAVMDCAPGFADCNGEPSDGCEMNTNTELQHCGACDNFCGVGGECTRGVCDVVSDVSAGADYTCVVRSPSGRVVCWGDNGWAQLGDFSTTTRETPVVVASVLDATNVETERYRNSTEGCPFTCAETPQLVYCWGCNRYGQMGDGDPEERNLMPEPVEDVPRFAGVQEPLLPGITVGGGHACAREDDDALPSAVLCWGNDADGQIGGSCADDSCQSTAVAGLPGGNADAVSAGWSHTCFRIGTDIYCTGDNEYGQLGSNDTSSRSTPSRVFGEERWASVAAGEQVTCGVRTDGVAMCWGKNDQGQLGIGETGSYRTRPAEVVGITDAVEVCIGPSHGCALLSDGSARCWGNGNLGQLGHGVAETVDSPVEVMTSARFVQISCGHAHSCALDGDGDVWCWGYNNRYQSGPMSAGTMILVPTRVPTI